MDTGGMTDYTNKIPLAVSPRQTIGDLMELGIFRGFERIEYCVRRKQFYGVVSQGTQPLLRPGKPWSESDSSLNVVIHALNGLEESAR